MTDLTPGHPGWHGSLEGEPINDTPTPAPTPPDSQAAASPLEIAEQGVDESVSRFISRLHEQIRSLTAKLAAAESALGVAREALEALSDPNRNPHWPTRDVAVAALEKMGRS